MATTAIPTAKEIKSMAFDLSEDVNKTVLTMQGWLPVCDNGDVERIARINNMMLRAAGELRAMAAAPLAPGLPK